MSVKLKALGEQTIVITGATSGIGLATAQAAARKGAKLVLAARGEEDLRKIEQALQEQGAQVVSVVADVGDREQVRRIGRAAVERFGTIDTWVNNAGVSVFGRLEDVPEEDHRRLFETNFWGVVHGSLEAVRLLKERGLVGGCGGALINLGSLASDQAFPMQGMYCASKHAIKGFTDALRMELEEEKAPISVTLIKPTSIDTPFAEHAGNYMGQAPTLPPPVYRPGDVALAILHAAANPRRDVYVGSAAKVMSVSNRLAPRLNDLFGEKTMSRAQMKEEREAAHTGSLYEAGEGGQVRGGTRRLVHPSLYTRASIHPMVTAAVLGVVGVALAAVMGGKGASRMESMGKVGERLREWM